MTCLGRGRGLMFLLTCLLRGMTYIDFISGAVTVVSTHMPLARHDLFLRIKHGHSTVSTHMPLARHDDLYRMADDRGKVSTHMPLARHDQIVI